MSSLGPYMCCNQAVTHGTLFINSLNLQMETFFFFLIALSIGKVNN